MEEPSAAILRSVEDLRSVSSAISNFISTWDDLRNVLYFINSSIDSFSAELDTTGGALPQLSATEIPQPEATESDNEDECESRASAASKERDDNQDVSKPDEVPKRNPNGNEDGNRNESKPDVEPKRKPKGKKEPVSEIQSICNTATAGKRLRRYVVERLHNGISKMYDEVPAALARSPDPAALVFACLGGFYKQGSKSFAQDRWHAASRRAAIIVLEFFILSGRVVPSDQLAPNLLKEANIAACTWKDRMVQEDGVSKAGSLDALGLLLLLASFGIPPQISNDDIASLYRLCNPKIKARVLRQSPILVPKVKEMVKDMVKDAQYLAAAELVTGFELQEEFPLLPLLSSYLDVIKRAGVDEQTEGKLSAISTKAACEEQLKNLQDLAKFLNKHNLHAEYASFEVDATISKLKKDLLNFKEEKTQNLNAKRKPEESVKMEGTETHLKHQNLNGGPTEENAQMERPNTHSKPKFVNSKKKTEGSNPLERAETSSKTPQNVNAKRKAGETAQLERPATHSKPNTMNAKRNIIDSTQLKRAETSSNPQNLNGKRKAEDSVPLERADKGPKTLQKLNTKRKDEFLNAKRDNEESASLGRITFLSRPPASQMNTAFENSVSSNTRDSASLRITSLEHPIAVPVPMNMQMNSGPPSTSTSGVSYSGMDRRFPGLLNHDIPALPARNNSYGFPDNGERDYMPPSTNHDSRMYDCFRDSCSNEPTTSAAFGLPQPSPGNVGQYLGAHAGVGHVSAWQSTAHVPLPHGTESRASGSASRYSFADMV